MKINNNSKLNLYFINIVAVASYIGYLLRTILAGGFLAAGGAEEKAETYLNNTLFYGIVIVIIVFCLSSYLNRSYVLKRKYLFTFDLILQIIIGIILGLISFI